jgi:hypothetical protein
MHTTKTEHIVTASRTPFHWQSVFQFCLATVAIISLWGTSLITTLAGLLELVQNPSGALNALQYSLLSASTFFVGALVVPSAVFAGARLLNRTLPPSSIKWNFLRPTRLIFSLPFIYIAGYLVTEYTDLAWLLLPPIHILAIGLPIAWLAYIGLRNLPNGTPQRYWGVFDAGMLLAPMLIIAFEFAVIAILMLGGVIVLASDPELLAEISDLVESFDYGSQSPEVFLDQIEPFLFKPVSLYVIFTFVAIIVPLLEELIKPIGVWLLFGHKLSPAAGYSAGLLSGAGFALVESLGMSVNSQEWGIVVAARIGTGAIHILTAGLMGWGLATSWRDHRYIRLPIIYLLAVGIHGLWNGLTLFYLATEFGELQTIGFKDTAWTAFGSNTPFILVLLAVGAFLSLLWLNKKMGKTDNCLNPPCEL